jgi:Flp pilus assembly pilin Flp
MAGHGLIVAAIAVVCTVAYNSAGTSIDTMITALAGEI